jgi:hypothetical protein
MQARVSILNTHAHLFDKDTATAMDPAMRCRSGISGFQRRL